MALDRVSLELGAGEGLVLLGPDGAGKTTLLQTSATLVRPTAGTLRLAEVDALREPERARPLIGMVGHGSYVYEDLTAIENLRFWATMHGQSAAEPPPARGARAGGARWSRRRARPDVLLGHEAAARAGASAPRGGAPAPARRAVHGPGPSGQQVARRILQGFKAGGGAIVLATHSFGGALGAANRVAILAGGRVLDRPTADLSADELRRIYDALTDPEAVRA